MGWRIAEEMQRHAPADLTWRERYVLDVLANLANEHTRVCRAGVDDDDGDAAVRMRLPRRKRYEVLSALTSKGIIVQLQRGQKFRQAQYLIVPLAPVGNETQGAGNRHPDVETQGADSGSSGCLKPVSQGAYNRHPSQGLKDSISRDPDSKILAAVATTLREKTSKTITDQWAAKVVRQLTDQYGTNHQPAYFARIIESRPDDFLPKSQPGSVGDVFADLEQRIEGDNAA